jgi:hypothetical protein
MAGYCPDKEGEVLGGPEVWQGCAPSDPHETAISAPPRWEGSTATADEFS